MTDLDEAIKHCEEVAEKQKEKGFLANAEANRSTVYGELCYECASEHRQLAEWLKELKQWREFGRRIGEVCADYIMVDAEVVQNDE